MAQFCVLLSEKTTDCITSSDIFLSYKTFFTWFLSSPTALTGLLAALIGTITASVAFYNIRLTRQSNMLHRALDFESTYQNTKEISEATTASVILLIKAKRKGTDSYFDELTELASYVPLNLETTKSRQLRNLLKYLNEWERCANGIYYGSYNANFLYSVYASTVINTFRLSLPFILARQGAFGPGWESRKKNQRAFIRFVRLATEWTIRKHTESFEDVPEDLRNALKLIKQHNRIVYEKKLLPFIFLDKKFPDELLIEAQGYLTSYMAKIHNIDNEYIQCSLR
ncbi:hypothetical protein ACOLZ1_000516 [Vibrio fluvialis]